MRTPRHLSLVFLAFLACRGQASFEAPDGTRFDYGGRPSSDDMFGDGPNLSGGNPQLTAGVWDDNENFDLYLDYLSRTATVAGAPGWTSDERNGAHKRFAQRTAKSLLDIAIVMDTTGSMHDEFEHLRTEFEVMSSSIAADFPGAEIRWALVAYGDEHDKYVVDAKPFTTDFREFRQILKTQPTTSGGDYPEASHAALAQMNQLAWRSGSVAKIVFWLADAPHHEDKARDMALAVRDAQAQDVHIYPVAASGADVLTEFTMRSAAQLTGGRYIFLTDDSGIGDSHKEPEIPCYFVTTLEDAIHRMVRIEMTGVYEEPNAAHVIRTGGDPTNRACKLSSGHTASAF